MTKCVRDYTVVNSQPSIEALEKLMSAFFATFGMVETIDDLFYYGVFCKPQNYANFKFDITENYDFDIPYNIMNYQANEEEKITKLKALELFDTNKINEFEVGTFNGLASIHKYLFNDIYSFAGVIRKEKISVSEIEDAIQSGQEKGSISLIN